MMNKSIWIASLFVVLVYPALIMNGQPKQEWKVIGKSGVVEFVYMNPNGLADKYFIAQALHTIMKKHNNAKMAQIWFFDDKNFTPTGFPMTDAQMLHHKAKYSLNRNMKVERFAFVTVKNAKTSPPELKEKEAKIRPGFAD